MKKFVINCDFGGQIAPFAVYIGTPEGAHHPLHFQADWLSKQRGGTIPPDVMDAVSKLKDLADKNNVSLEELCVYALGAAQQAKDEGGDDSNADTATSSVKEDTNDKSSNSAAEDDDDLLDFDDIVLEEDEDNDDENYEGSITNEDEATGSINDTGGEDTESDPEEVDTKDKKKPSEQ